MAIKVGFYFSCLIGLVALRIIVERGISIYHI